MFLTMSNLMCAQNFKATLDLVIKSKTSLVVLSLKEMVGTSFDCKIIDSTPSDILAPHVPLIIEDVRDPY